jgi:hypothetical protein
MKEDSQQSSALAGASAIISVMKLHAPTTPAKKVASKRKLESGLPGTPEEQRRELRAAIKKHAETLRRLAQ